MSYATLRVTFTNVTLVELVEHLDKLRFAGWGAAACEFPSVVGNGCVEVKLSRTLDTPKTPPEQRKPIKQ